LILAFDPGVGLLEENMCNGDIVLPAGAVSNPPVSALVGTPPD